MGQFAFSYALRLVRFAENVDALSQRVEAI